MSYPGKPYCFDIGTHGGCVHPDAQRTLGYPVRRDPVLKTKPRTATPERGGSRGWQIHG